MKRLMVAALVCVPSIALALDPIVDANKDVTCGNSGETFYPYGDVWAFLPGGACKGTDPTMANGNLEAEAAEKTDQTGHCVWINFDNRGPIRKTGTTGTAADHSERARRVVFASMRKWAGYKMGKATLGGALEWACPTTGQTDSTPPTTYKTAVDYDFGVGNNSKPTLNFFRGPDVPPTVSMMGATVANRGDEYECFAECAPGQSCAGLTTAMLGGKTYYTCTTGKTVAGGERHRIKKVRHNVVWVQGAGEWNKQTGAGPEVLASTEVIFWQDNGVIISGDMVFNNEHQDWQFHDPNNLSAPAEGCVNTPNCYYLETVATHEAGHLIGLGHVNCTEAVMVPSAKTTDEKYDLSKHDTAGVCSVYRPSSEGRYPNTGREGEGCFDDTTCGTGNKCLFSAQSFYGNAMDLATVADLAMKIPHRGVCVKNTVCVSDSDCDPTRGRVCQEVNATTGEKHCIAGSPLRPRSAGTVADFCAPCEDGLGCNSICADTSALGIAASVPNAPAKICTAKCDPALGCASGFTCSRVGSINMCVPQDPVSCIEAGASARAQLNELCTEKACAAGLTCYPFSESVAVCLEQCSKTSACKTPGYGCLPKIEVGANGMLVALDEGGCFKKSMSEGDNCSLPSNVMCGLTCTGSGNAEVCTRNEDRLCVSDTPDPQQSKCYTFCSSAAQCKGAAQACALEGAPELGGIMYKGAPAGVCNPPQLGTCLKGIGEPCTQGTECDSSLCQAVNGASICTQYCDLRNRSGCPLAQTCVEAGGKGVCKPDGTVTARCGSPTVSGCNCESFDAGNTFEVALALLAVLAWRRRRRV